MFLNSTRHCSNNNNNRSDYLGRSMRRFERAIVIFAIVSATILTTFLSGVSAAANRESRLRWHQVDLRQYSEDDVKTEIKFGREVAAKILATMPPSDDDSLNRYLSLVGQSLVYHSSRNELQFHFTLLKSNTVGAYSAPGGYIFVTEGLFNLLENEAELAAVLAHEISHINLRHIVKELNIKATKKEELSNLARFLGASGDTTRAVINQAVDKAYEVLFKNGFKKSQELNADASAIELLALTGYDPNALAAVLLRIGKLKGNHNSKTHPQFSKRDIQLHQLTQHMAQAFNDANKAALRFQQYRTRSKTP